MNAIAVNCIILFLEIKSVRGLMEIISVAGIAISFAPTKGMMKNDR